MNENLKEWDLWEAGKRFNSRLKPPQRDMIEVNWDMFGGNQWINSGAADDLPKPVFNIINRIISFFVASLTSSAVKVNFDTMTNVPMNDNDDPGADVEMINAAWENFAERVKLQDLVRQLYLNGAIEGDMALHFYFDPDQKPYDGKYSDVKGEIMVEVKESGEIFFGNPNSRDAQSQPHIIVSGRATVQELQAEYDEHNQDKFEVGSDTDDEYDQIELEETDELGKASYVIYYCKKKSKVKKVDIDEFGVETETTEEVETVHVSKLIRDRYIYKGIDTGLKLYPVSFNNWEKQRSNYHGRALCTSIVPNQIFINRMFAMAMQNLMLTSMPKLIYDADRFAAAPSNRVGVAIGIEGMNPGDNISNLMKYLEPGNMSTQVAQLIEMSIEFTKDMLGANSALLGSVNPEQASGTSITIAARQSGVPLENPKNSMYELLDDSGRIFLDMVSNYYGERPVVVEAEDGRTVITYDFEKLNDIYLTTKADVGATTYWNEIAMIQTLDNLLERDKITFLDYLERVPENYIPDKQGLINSEIEKQQAQMQQAQPQQPNIEEIIASMSPEMQQQFQSLQPEQQQTFIQEYIQGGA